MTPTESIGRPTPKRQSARSKVLKAATELFGEKGFEGASIDSIAQKAGVSKPTIYSHFSNKSGLFAEILNQACENISAPMIEEGALTGPLARQLVRIGKTYAQTLLAPQVTTLYRLVVAESERFPELAQKYFDTGPVRVYSAMVSFLEARMEAGEITRQDPKKLAEIFGSMVVAPLRLQLLFKVSDGYTPEEIERHCEAVVETFLNGVAVRP